MGCVAVVWLTVALQIPTQSCVLPAGYLGLTYFQDGRPLRVQLARDRVVSYVRPGLPGDPQTIAPAVWVVAHELGHCRTRSSDEKIADRWATRNWSLVVRTLGGSWSLAVRLWSYLR